MHMTSSNKMTLNFLKSLFYKKYGDVLFIKNKQFNIVPEISVIMTNDQYRELNEDIARLTRDSIMMVMDETERKSLPEASSHMKITLPSICEFIVEVGEDFDFKLFDPTQEHGDEEL